MKPIYSKCWHDIHLEREMYTLYSICAEAHFALKDRYEELVLLY